MLVATVTAAAPLARAQIQTTGTPGSPSATTTIDGHISASTGSVRRCDQPHAQDSKPYWPPTVVPPKGAPNILLIITDDAGFGVAEHVRRRHPDAGPGSHRQGRSALHAVPLHGAVLADAGGADHRPQPPLGRFRRDHRAIHGLPRLQQHHHQGQRDHRRDPEGQRLRHLLVRQEPQHARPSSPARPGHSISGPSGMGFEYFYGFMGGETNQWQPTCSATPRRSIRRSASPAAT